MQLTRLHPLNALTVGLIGFYQRRLSPFKGFRCAYRVRTGRSSCSEHVRRAVARHGVLTGLLLARRRFAACRVAYNHLQSDREEEKRRRREQGGASGNTSPDSDCACDPSDACHCIPDLGCADLSCPDMHCPDLPCECGHCDCGGCDIGPCN